MGAQRFETFQPGDDLRQAFIAAREQAAWDHGHAGYTGTLAEKDDVEARFGGLAMTEKDARDFAEKDGEANEKWGPAFAVRVVDGDKRGFLFYGWASC